MKENTSKFKPNKLAALAFALLALQGSALANGLKEHCKQHFKNTDICIIADKEYTRWQLEKSGDIYASNTLLQTIKTMTLGVASYENLPSTLRSMEKALASKKSLKYQGFSYCKGVEPYIWNGLAQMGATKENLQSHLAKVCGK